MTHGSSDTFSHGTADTVLKGTADSRGTSDAVSTTDTHTNSHSVSNTWGETWGESNTVGSADGKSAAWGHSHQTGDTAGEATGRGGQAAFGGGFSAGFAPAIAIGQSFQTEDDEAIRLTEILRGLEGVVNQVSLEGGFMTNAFLISAGERGATAAAALVPLAFHGPNVPTPILTITPDPLDELTLREHALAIAGLTIGPALLWQRYETQRDKFRRDYDEALSECLQLLREGFGVTGSVPDALDHAARNGPDQAAADLREVWSAQVAGTGLEDAVAVVVTRRRDPYLRMAAEALTLKQTEGGSISEVLLGLETMVREQVGLQREIIARQTQARLESLIIALAPLFFLWRSK